MLATESPKVVRATGTDDQYCGNEGAIDSYIQTHAPRSAGPRARARVEKKAQRAGRESLQSDATVCEDKGGIEPTQLLPNPLRLTEIDDTLRITATECDAAAPLAQLAEQLTLNQFDSAKNPEKHGVSEKIAAVGADKATSDGILQGWLDTCPVPLPASVMAGIKAMVKAVGKAKRHPI